MEFRRKFLVFDEVELEYFNKNSSMRTFESCEQELKSLEKYYNLNRNINFEYDKVILSDSDKIFNVEHQKEYYVDKYILLKNHAHDIFYNLNNLDEILKIDY
jgi:hypothetical protein